MVTNIFETLCLLLRSNKYSDEPQEFIILAHVYTYTIYL